MFHIFLTASGEGGVDRFIGVFFLNPSLSRHQQVGLGGTGSLPHCLFGNLFLIIPFVRPLVSDKSHQEMIAVRKRWWSKI